VLLRSYKITAAGSLAFSGDDSYSQGKPPYKAVAGINDAGYVPKRSNPSTLTLPIPESVSWLLLHVGLVSYLNAKAEAAT